MTPGRGRELLLAAQGWWPWAIGLAGVVWGMVAYEHVIQRPPPAPLVLSGERTRAFYPLAIDTGGYCRIVFVPQVIRRSTGAK